MRHFRPLAAIATLILAGCSGGGSDNPPASSTPAPVQTLSIDCTGTNAGCPSLTIDGDPPATLPDGSASPVAGFADPSLRRDPAGTTLWLGYSWVYPALGGPMGTSVVGAEVDTHLARSDDGGQSWTKVATLWRAVPGAQDEFARSGRMNSETVSLAPRQSVSGTTTWYSARMVYFSSDDDGPAVSSFTVHVAAAAAPDQLGIAEEAVLGGDLTRTFWAPDVNLASLTEAVPGDELNGCTFFDAGLLFHGDRLYLAVQCALYAPSGEDVTREFVALFSTQPNGSPRLWNWTYHGKLADRSDAIALGGENLQQTDLAAAQDGTLLAIFSPSDPTGNATLSQHFGCRVVEIASLNPARLARDGNGALRVRASITASDLTSPNGSPASCGYEASSATGVLIARRDDRNGLHSALHRTGLRP